MGSWAELRSASFPTSKKIFQSSQSKASDTTVLPPRYAVPEQPRLALLRRVQYQLSNYQLHPQQPQLVDETALSHEDSELLCPGGHQPKLIQEN